jgi:hypothetical protein
MRRDGAKLNHNALTLLRHVFGSVSAGPAG